MQAPGMASPAKLETVVPMAADASVAETREQASTDAICGAFEGDGDGDGAGDEPLVEDEDELPHATARRATVASARVRANIVGGRSLASEEVGVKRRRRLPGRR